MHYSLLDIISSDNDSDIDINDHNDNDNDNIIQAKELARNLFLNVLLKLVTMDIIKW